ncbi:MAG TPA: hypothetical protein PK156_46790, partial [Polyangium sp.]|nr:hypothetical protein [Polyangium sp.]
MQSVEPGILRGSKEKDKPGIDGFCTLADVRLEIPPRSFCSKKNFLLRSNEFLNFMLAALASVTLLACGPTIERADDTGGSGGSGGSSSSGGSSGPDTPSLRQIDLGPTKLNILQAFDVPEHALGITAIVEAPKLDDLVGISRLRTPSNEYVTYNFSVMGKTNSVFADLGWVAAGSVQSDLPQAWPVQAGSWRILVGSDVQLPSANVRIWVRKTIDGAFHGGVVDVNMFVAPNAAPPAYLSLVMNGVFQNFAGLSLGNVKFLSLDAAFSTISTFEQFDALLASSVVATTTPALNVFAINEFGSEYFGAVIGVAGGIPGSATINGTTISGLAYHPSGTAENDI